MSRIKPYTCQKRLEGSNKILGTPESRDSMILSETCLWAFECFLWRAWISSDLPWGQGLWLQHNWEVWHVNSTIEPPSRQPTNWRTFIPKKFSHCCESSRVHSRFPNLGIRQKNWEPLGNLTLKASLDSYTELTQDFPCGAAGKESACNVGDLGSIPGCRRSSGEGNGYPLQYSGLENSTDRGDLQVTVHGITMNQT